MTNPELVTLDVEGSSCTTRVFGSAASQPRPAVILLMDGFGLRPALDQVALRIASAGYVVAVPDLFHRVGSVFEAFGDGQTTNGGDLMKRMMADPELRPRWRARFLASATDPEHVQADVGAVLAYLQTRSDVRPGAVALVGYCMGGMVAMRSAAMFGEQIVAVGCFHGGYLATDAPDSPHLGAAQIKARLFVAGAQDDPSFPDDMKERLHQAFEQAGLTACIETYPGRHGFCIPDSLTFDPDLAERHYEALFDLLQQTF